MSDVRSGALARLLTNPFTVLGLPPTASPAEIERQGQKLLAQLASGKEAAAPYSSPVGLGQRTPDLVRWSIDQLRDPKRRFVHELWAGLPSR